MKGTEDQAEIVRAVLVMTSGTCQLDVSLSCRHQLMTDGKGPTISTNCSEAFSPILSKGPVIGLLEQWMVVKCP